MAYLFVISNNVYWVYRFVHRSLPNDCPKAPPPEVPKRGVQARVYRHKPRGRTTLQCELSSCCHHEDIIIVRDKGCSFLPILFHERFMPYFLYVHPGIHILVQGNPHTTIYITVLRSYPERRSRPAGGKVERIRG